MSRTNMVTVVALALVATLGGFAQPSITQAATSPFTDIDGTTFEADIEWLRAEGITVGCSDTRYCPNDVVTRGQMATFLVRMFDLTDGAAIDAFTDDDGTTHEKDINRLAHVGLTKGCTPTTFCPMNPIRRDEMATFLARAVPLADGAGNDYFRDDDGTTHEANIDRAAAAGLASGCYPSFYCPARSVTRGEMAGFLHRVVMPITPPPYPAPKGPMTLYVEAAGVDTSNGCLDASAPCATVRHALDLALDGDTVAIGPGSFHEEGLYVGDDLTIVGDPGGGTVLDASGGKHRRVISVLRATVTMSDLTLTGGRDTGAAIRADHATLAIVDSTIIGNQAVGFGGGIMSWMSDITITRSTISGNTAYAGGAVTSSYGHLTIVASAINDNTARYGSAIYKGYASPAPASVVIVNSTIARNTSTDGWGSIFIGELVQATIVNSTVSGNVATRGGGIRADPGAILGLVNALVVGNVAPTDADVSGAITSKLASIVGAPAGLTLADILDPDGLADNGGPTQTIALTDSAKNPAIGKGDAATCAAAPVGGVDQRGEPRTPPCDIGAYELQP